MRVLILEPHASGHHASYLRWLVQAAAAKRWSVVIASTRSALSHPSLATLASDFGDVRTHLIADFPVDDGRVVRAHRLLRREFVYWKAFNRAAAVVRGNVPIDAVILPYVDYCFYALAILGSPFGESPWCAISMRLQVAQDAANGRPRMSVKWRLAKRILASPALKKLFVINPSVENVPANWFSPAMRSKLRYLPDPAEYDFTGSRGESRAALGISNGQVAILVFGSIDERKGIDSLLNGLALQNDLDSYVVILAGRQSVNVRDQVQAAACAELLSQKRLIVINRFLTTSEQNRVFAAADVVWVGYRNHVYMSGVMVLAGKAGVPVLGSPEGEIGRLIAKYDLGYTARLDRPAEITSALRALLDAHKRAEMGEKAQSAFASHTMENFGAEVTAAFDSLQRI
jgi:glycosyltransferase involved in cell wall biosynthesis